MKCKIFNLKKCSHYLFTFYELINVNILFLDQLNVNMNLLSHSFIWICHFRSCICVCISMKCDNSSAAEIRLRNCEHQLDDLRTEHTGDWRDRLMHRSMRLAINTKFADQFCRSPWNHMRLSWNRWRVKLSVSSSFSSSGFKRSVHTIHSHLK